METLDITLGGRTYPLTLSPEEVDVVRAAAEAVEAQIAQLKSQYAISDRIDLMAMAALQIAVQAQSNATSCWLNFEACCGGRGLATSKSR